MSCAFGAWENNWFCALDAGLLVIRKGSLFENISPSALPNHHCRSMGDTYGHSAAIAGLRAEPLTASSDSNSAIAERSRRSEGGSQHIVVYSWREFVEVVV